MNQDIRFIFEQYADVVKNKIAKSNNTTQLKVITKLDRENLDKSEVLVEGYGVVLLGQLKDNTASKLEDLAQHIKKNEPEFVYKKIMERHGIIMTFIKTLVLAEKDIEHMRRAGKLPGLVKRFL
jgi:hypothetical protein